MPMGSASMGGLFTDGFTCVVQLMSSEVDCYMLSKEDDPDVPVSNNSLNP
jgi:hypothetical protein